MSIPNPIRRRAGNLLVLGVTLALLLGLYLWRHHAHVRGTRFHDEIRGRAWEGLDFGPVSVADLVRLGSAQHHGARPESSYLLHPEAKAPGTLRVGMFGCSFVYGEEAPPGFDPASRLESFLHEHGRRRAEVVNFGVRGFGVQQSVLLWRLLAPRYDLDLVVFGLHAFHAERDVTFVQLADAYGPVHARHVLDGDGLRLLEAVGPDPAAASAHYFRLPTPWRYLRYDAKTPAFLRPLLPRGRELRSNPFYYHPDPAAEARELHARLLAEVAAGSPRLLVTCDTADTCAFAEGAVVGDAAFVEARAYAYGWGAASLLRAPEKHPSALGYELAARELGLLLLGEDPRRRLPRIRLGPPEPGSRSPAGTTDLAPLDAWDAVDLVVGGRPASVLVRLDGEGVGHAAEATALGAALLDISDRRDLRYLVLPGPPADGAEVTLAFRRHRRRHRAHLATVRATGGVLAHLAEPRSTTPGVEVRLDRRPEACFADGDGVGSVAVELAGRVLLAGEAVPGDGRRRCFTLRPRLPLLHVRARPDQELRLDDLGRRGTVHLRLRRGAETVLVPAASYAVTAPRPRRPGPWPWPLAPDATAPDGAAGSPSAALRRSSPCRFKVTASTDRIEGAAVSRRACARCRRGG